MTDFSGLLPLVEPLARQAGERILSVYHGDFAVEAKSDGSPVTLADQLAEEIIRAGLEKIGPEVPMVAEEAAEAGDLPEISGGTFWLVDPLDGTKQFIQRVGEFTVNIGLIHEGMPVLGVVHAPALGLTYLAAGPGTAVAEAADGSRQPIQVRRQSNERLMVVASRSHRSPELEAYLAKLPPHDATSAGSSLKFCMVASGAADLYPRIGRTMEWDTAAGHAVVLGAGGTVERLDENGPLTYGKPGFENPHFLVRGA